MCVCIYIPWHSLGLQCIGSVLCRLRSLVSCWCLEKNTISPCVNQHQNPWRKNSIHLKMHVVCSTQRHWGRLQSPLIWLDFKWTADSPKCCSLSAEIQWREAAVIFQMDHPASCSLQQYPTHLYTAPLCCDVKRRRPLMVNCIHGASLWHKQKRNRGVI